MNRKKTFKVLLLLMITALWVMGTAVSASEDDNSLASLGILTEGAEVSPELTYGIIEYNVTVPAGTTELELDPEPMAEGAWIVDINGTTLVDGKATVEIVVSAANGDQYSYYLYVTEDGEGTAAQTEPETQTEEETETEPETEDPRYIKVDRDSLEEAENTITALKTETGSYRSKVGILTKILYGMIAFCVILLFIVISLLLKKKDLKAEVNAYRSLGYAPGTPEDYANGQDYNGQAYDNQGYYGYEGRNSQEGHYEEPSRTAQKKDKKEKDDPTTVPKPPKTQKKPMPEYQQPAQPYEYQQPSGEKKDSDVEVTMVDL